MAAERRGAGQDRQVALLVERLDAHDRVVAPERAAVADPPGLPHGVGAHAVAHAELEDAGEGALGGHADDQALQDADLGMGLHHAGEAHDLLARHQAVGIERQHQRVVGAPAGAEVAHVAGLVACVVGAAAIDDAVAVGIGGLPGLDRLLLGGGDGGVVGVAQHEPGEGAALAGRIDAGLDRAQAQDGALGVLVAQRHEHGRLDAQRRRRICGSGVGRHLGQAILVEMQEPQADQGVPEAEHGPGRAGREAQEQDHVHGGPAAGAEHLCRRPQQARVGDQIEGKHDLPPARQHVDGLEAGWCRKAQAHRRLPRSRGVETVAHATFI